MLPYTMSTLHQPTPRAGSIITHRHHQEHQGDFSMHSYVRTLECNVLYSYVRTLDCYALHSYVRTIFSRDKLFA